MGDIQNLSNEDAIRKMQELAGNEVCLMCTFGEDEEMTFRPMSTLKVDDHGHFWFFSDRRSHKDEQIDEYNKVYLLYSVPGKQNYMSVQGSAILSNDKAKVDELWNPIAKAWFKDGKDDPYISVIEVTPHKAHYWDTKHGKMVSFLKILASVVSGKTSDDGVEGELHISETKY
jgi:general stress protein 26